MNTKHQSGSAHLIIIISLVVVVLGALGFVFWQNFMSKQSSESATTQSSVDTTTLLTKLQDELTALPHRSDTTTASTGLHFSTSDPVGMSVVHEYEVDVVFNASLYANNPDVAPVGTTGSNGSGAEEALDKDKVNAILIDNGLKITDTFKDTSQLYSDLYSNDSVTCVVADSQGLASVRCTTTAHINAARTAVSNAISALKLEYPDVVLYDPIYTTFYENDSDEGTQGVYVSIKSGIKEDVFDAFLVKSLSEDWHYLTSNVLGNTAYDSPACSEFQIAKYGNIFSVKDCE
jgi:hypothetical protein